MENIYPVEDRNRPIRKTLAQDWHCCPISAACLSIGVKERNRTPSPKLLDEKATGLCQLSEICRYFAQSRLPYFAQP